MLTGITRVLASATPLILLVILSRFSTLEQIGLLGYFLALITILGVITDFGLPETVQRFLPLPEYKKNLFSFLFIEFIVVVLATVVFAVLDVTLKQALSQGYLDLVLLCILASSSNVIIMCFNGLGRNSSATAYFLLSSLSFIIITIGLVTIFNQNPVQAFLVGRFVSWTISGLLALGHLIIRHVVTYSVKITKPVTIFIINSFVIAICTSIISSWDGLLVQQVLGSEVNAFYRSGMLIGTLPNVLGVVAITVLLPMFSIGLTNKLFKYTALICVLSITMIFGGVLLGNWGLNILFGSNIALNAYIYLLGGLTISAFFVTSVPAYAYLLATGKQLQVTGLWILQAAILVGLSFTAISNGAVYLMLLQVALMAIYSLLIIGLAFKLQNQNTPYYK